MREAAWSGTVRGALTRFAAVVSEFLPHAARVRLAKPSHTQPAHQCGWSMETRIPNFSDNPLFPTLSEKGPRSKVVVSHCCNTCENQLGHGFEFWALSRVKDISTKATKLCGDVDTSV